MPAFAAPTTYKNPNWHPDRSKTVSCNVLLPPSCFVFYPILHFFIFFCYYCYSVLYTTECNHVEVKVAICVFMRIFIFRVAIKLFFFFFFSEMVVSVRSGISQFIVENRFLLMESLKNNFSAMHKGTTFIRMFDICFPLENYFCKRFYIIVNLK